VGSGAAGRWRRNGAPYLGTSSLQLHQAALGPAAVEPGMAEVMAEPVREYLDAALAAAADDDLYMPLAVIGPRLLTASQNCPSRPTHLRDAVRPRSHLRRRLPNQRVCPCLSVR
jgi:hypothetical protein